MAANTHAMGTLRRWIVQKTLSLIVNGGGVQALMEAFVINPLELFGHMQATVCWFTPSYTSLHLADTVRGYNLEEQNLTKKGLF